MTHPTKRRTYSRDQWEAAQAAWAGFSSEWRDTRHLAAMEAGIIVPPEGSEWDSWADESPSERAIIIRAIRETPALLRSAIRSPRVHSWAAVIAVLVRHRDEMRLDADRWQDHERRQRSFEPTREEAAASLKAILEGIR